MKTNVQNVDYVRENVTWMSQYTNSAECIRCGKCIKVCPRGAIKTTFTKTKEAACNSKCSGCKSNCASKN